MIPTHKVYILSLRVKERTKIWTFEGTDMIGLEGGKKERGGV